MSKLHEAAELMKRAHGGQTRKDGRPYWAHPLAVFDVATMELGVTDEDAKLAALLHDVVEDTPVPLAELREWFGVRAAEMVELLTKQPVPQEGKAAMLQRYYEGLRKGPEVVRQVKIADRVHNLREMRSASRAFAERYLPETVELIAVLAATRGIELLKSEYARAESAYLHQLLEGSGTW